MFATPIKITTPIGTAKYPWITEPDTKFNPDGEYRVELIMESGDDTAALFDKLNSYRDASVAEYKKAAGGKAVKVTTHFPMMTLEDGTISIKAKLKSKVTTKTGRSWDQRPALFDARGAAITNDIRIGSGSRMRLSIEVSAFNAPAIGGVGISLRLRGVQVIEVREPRATSASDFGFGAEETGFVTETFDSFEDDAPKPTKPTASKKAVGKVDF
jgi:hypothetical protein